MKSALYVAGAAAAIVVTGCSSSGSNGPGPSETPSASTAVSAGVCATLTSAINAAADASWRSPTETDNGTLHNCAFGPSDPGVLALQIEDGMSHAGFANNRALVAGQGTLQAVAHLGDEAYSQTLNGATLVSVRQGDVGVAVQLQQGDKNTAITVARAALSVLVK